MIVGDGSGRFNLRSGGDDLRAQGLTGPFRSVVLFGGSVRSVCLLRGRACSRLLCVVRVGRNLCVGRVCSGELGFFAHRLAESGVVVGPSHAFHHSIRGGGEIGVSRLGSINVGQVGLVGRVVVGACCITK